MSALEACGLYLGAELFVRWNPKIAMEPLVPVVVTSAELTSDMNPRHLHVVVSRVSRVETGENTLKFDVLQETDDGIPFVTMQKTGEEVVWTLCSRTMVRGVTQSGLYSGNQIGVSISSTPDMKTAYARPLRTLSYSVQTNLYKFPCVSVREMDGLGNYLRRDIRSHTACTLLEWESIVQYVVRKLAIPVQHEPSYRVRDVPRYDLAEMTLQFPTLHSLLRLFRHLTLDTIRNIIYKEKTRRRRKVSSSVRRGPEQNGPELVQLVGDFVSQSGIFAFTIGSRFYPEAKMPRRFLYPVLFRESDEWNNLDRMFVHDLDVKLLDEPSLSALQEHRREDSPPARKRGRKRVYDSFMGLKWVRDAAHNGRSMRFHSFNADEIQGELHFCVPTFVFLGQSYAPKIRSLVNAATGIFDLR